MPEIDYDLAHFFAWARAKAYAELERRTKADPSLDQRSFFRRQARIAGRISLASNVAVFSQDPGGNQQI